MIIRREGPKKDFLHNPGGGMLIIRPTQYNRLVAMGFSLGKNGSFSPTLHLFSVT
jgi:hypothetical protein